MKSLKNTFLSLLFILIILVANAQDHVHPRGLISLDDVEQLQSRIKKEPYKSIFEKLINYANDAPSNDDLRKAGNQAVVAAFLYLVTEQQSWAEKAYQSIARIITDTTIYLNPISRGLNRATMLQKAALTYDFAYSGWSEIQRQRVNEAIYKGIYSVNANMGHMANYAIASNWMGVRYGSVVLASLIWDDTGGQKRNPVQPLLWDATNRLKDHIEANIYPEGWNGESLGYFGYGWSFVGPALIAMENAFSSISLESYAPNAINSLWAQSISYLPITTIGSKGMNPDISDDNLNANFTHLYAMGMRLYPDAQKPALKWMHDYSLDVDLQEEVDHLCIYSILYRDENLQALNPASLGWSTFRDHAQGIILVRNRYQDENDILFAYSATETRVKGHQGPDTNTIRLLGLGVPWIIGGGRTGIVHGQSTLFPALDKTPEENTGEEGELHWYDLNDKVSGAAYGTGSSVGVEGHHRLVKAVFKPANNVEALFMVKDSSQNGRRWRINTPEFNDIEVLDDGFVIKAPNGASLKGTVLRENDGPMNIKTGTFPYGGKTVRLNPGIQYQGEKYTNKKWVDVHCDGKITVVLTLVDAGNAHPAIDYDEQLNAIRLNSNTYVTIPKGNYDQ